MGKAGKIVGAYAAEPKENDQGKSAGRDIGLVGAFFNTGAEHIDWPNRPTQWDPHQPSHNRQDKRLQGIRTILQAGVNGLFVNSYRPRWEA